MKYYITNNVSDSDFKKLKYFYLNRYNEKYKKCLANTSLFCYCINVDEVVGAMRIITDMGRFAFIVDLNVAKKYRRQGIGSEIMRLVIRYCKENEIRKIFLTTNSKYPWLVRFYERLDFKILNKGKCMVYE